MDAHERRELYNNVIEVDNETTAVMTRTTLEGRTLRYELNVLQQPERARACGQGVKSQTDRRPVDPPPIIELTIKEGEGDRFDKDVTQSMHANYVMFASLEQARPMARARGHPEKSAPTVLTGSPVAGMVYLDRPKPAFYFIFSDLSVRHEGKYRFGFSLFEEVKEPGDADKSDATATPGSPDPGALSYRFDVRTQPFVVYSAKKFPGLNTSTPLSRLVAEQGCRVRIRRDVRMRRRGDAKPGREGPWDHHDHESARPDLAARVSATPDPRLLAYMDPVPQSPSDASRQSHSDAPSRRASVQDMGEAYAAHAHQPPAPPAYAPSYNSQHYPAPSGPSQSHYQSQNHMAPSPVGPMPSHHPQWSYGSAPAPPPSPSVYEPHQQSLSEHHHHRQHHPHATPSQSSPPVHSGFAPHAQEPRHAYPAPITTPRQPTPTGYPSAHAHSGHYASRPPLPAPSPAPSVASASSRAYQPPAHANASTSSLNSTIDTTGPPLAVDESLLEPSDNDSPSGSDEGTFDPSSMRASISSAAAGKRPDHHKRSYGRVFNARHVTAARLQNGERPQVPSASAYARPAGAGALEVDHDAPTDPKISAASVDAEDPDDEAAEMDPTMAVGKMRYRRADGSQVTRGMGTMMR
ncbi:uncharacterized protein K489DRAFT_13610 [Dissoconium aciculare CBS 342.82]|uniref:Velvet domain-containing protein n=1 Tax=Dissoconium aciculare CBS 342.82 TaxID=1314786 RepID=A0A6J3MHD5_9PEZI|nr:uncharacterized protein K489DRAFT_13610 [Dissoconium aciculare CBS 342.82]KAF1827355.1 hypothetical protein K489DRAFT_13610 [Dissoconium aciculare CBS 342.82]